MMGWQFILPPHFLALYCVLLPPFLLARVGGEESITETAASQELAYQAGAWNRRVADGFEIVQETQQAACLGILGHVGWNLL